MVIRIDDPDIALSVAGNPEETWNYYAGELVYKITPALYAAARYSGATTDMSETDRLLITSSPQLDLSRLELSVQLPFRQLSFAREVNPAAFARNALADNDST